MYGTKIILFQIDNVQLRQAVGDGIDSLNSRRGGGRKAGDGILDGIHDIGWDVVDRWRNDLEKSLQAVRL
jgi:hypothetical protein